MDEGKTTNTTPAPQMGPGELTALARRLRARADSVLFRDQPEQQRDLHAAAVAIDQLIQLLAEIRRAADATQDESTERHLREMLGGA
jgi:hypothetical protein